MKIFINNNIDQSVNSSFIKDTLRNCFRFAKENKIIPENVEIELSVALVDKKQIQTHNREYRDKDEPTDVLSFAYEKDEKLIDGELILCPEVIRENAKEDGIPFEDEFRKNLVHGFLHILGYEHGKEMFGLQERFRELFN